MPKANSVLTETELLEAAIEGLEAQRARIDEQIREARSRLAGIGKLKSAPRTTKKKRGRRAKKRKLSPEARERISMAQKKRWAKFRKKSG